MSSRPRLVAVPRPAEDRTADPVPGTIRRSRLPHRGRPCDRLECWFVDADVVADLAARAFAARLSFDTAACVLVEHGLITSELLGHGAVLDRLAATTTARGELTDATAAYLRSLTIGTEPPPEAHPDRLRLPARLTDRILVHDGPTRLVTGDLRQALTWEVAAVRTGATMTEWSLRAVLRA